MSTAIALVQPSRLPVSEGTARDSSPVSSGLHPKGEQLIYGDSTPFPYEWSAIDAIRATVLCCVELLRCQHSIGVARSREWEAERQRQMARLHLGSLADAVQRALASQANMPSEVITRTAARIVEGARDTVDHEIMVTERVSQAEILRLRGAMAEARDRAFTAVETLLARHDLPGAQRGFCITMQEQGYAAEAMITTPFGLSVVFDLSIAPQHPWTKHRRVHELRKDSFVHVPRQGGMLSKKVGMTRVSLDKYYVLGAAADGDRATMTLGRSPRNGEGFIFDICVEGNAKKVTVTELGEGGAPIVDSTVVLPTGDRESALLLFAAVRDSMADLLSCRTHMKTANMDTRSLIEEEPQDTARRMIDSVAPIIAELSRRSGAPGELVIRRTVSNGRRDEVYITKAELLEHVMTLPPALRGVFEPLHLAEGPRSPRAPLPSMAPYNELVRDAEIEDDE